MDEKKAVYEIILSIWNLFKEYGFKQLSDDEWENLRQQADKLEKESKKQGKLLNRLFRDMFAALQEYYKGKVREEQEIKGQMSISDLTKDEP